VTQSYVISRYEDVERVFKDKKSEFTTENYDWQLEPVHGRTILQLSGREHAVRRALVAPAFRGSDLQQKFLPVIEHNSRTLIDTFRHTRSADLVSDYATRFPVNVIADMLGLDKADHDRFHRWYTAVIAFLGNLSGDPEVAAAGERTRVEFAEYMIPVIRERRDHSGEDLLSTLCAAEVDVEVSGGTIPKGATVTCLIGAANRDEHRYRDPDRFDIFREDLTTSSAFSAAADHLAFALGRHFCVGALLAKAEVETGISDLLDAMPDVRLADGFDPVEQGVFTRGPQSLPVRFTPATD
jgi:pulcherriminic acid synthase